MDLRRVEAQAVEEPGGRPHLGGKGLGVLADLLAQPVEQGLLEREDEGRGLRRH